MDGDECSGKNKNRDRGRDFRDIVVGGGVDEGLPEKASGKDPNKERGEPWGCVRGRELQTKGHSMRGF